MNHGGKEDRDSPQHLKVEMYAWEMITYLHEVMQVFGTRAVFALQVFHMTCLLSSARNCSQSTASITSSMAMILASYLTALMLTHMLRNWGGLG
jgi:hypothetical protein